MATVASNRFTIQDFTRAYRNPQVGATTGERVESTNGALACCFARPRNCRVDLLNNKTKMCHTGRYTRVSSAFSRIGQEDGLRGRRGSGTIFFSVCNLRCVFCQNWDTSQPASERELDAMGIADLMLAVAFRYETR